MEIRKGAAVLSAGMPTEQELEKINAQAKSPLTAEDVYVFAVRVCDDRIDRDGERFSAEAVEALAPLLCGKPAIGDHAWSTERQLGRIFDTQVIREDGVCWLKAWIYMLKSEKNAELIREIEAGIKKEVSVGCAVGKRCCSVCGAERGMCGHEKGEWYDGVQCADVLCEPTDAYEISFVAVPAQKDAGVVKSAKEAAQKQLEKDAACGRLFRKQLCEEVVQKTLLLELGLEKDVLLSAAEKLDTEQLLAFRKALAVKAAELFPPRTQLTNAAELSVGDDSAFMI